MSNKGLWCDSFGTVICDQMELRKRGFVPSVLTLQAITVGLLLLNSVCNRHSKALQSAKTDCCTCWE